MEILRILIFALLLFVFGCTPPTRSEVAFADVSFKIPMTVEQAKDIFHLQYEYDGLTIVLRQFENRTLRSVQVAISFYKGIKQSDLIFYVENL